MSVTLAVTEGTLNVAAGTSGAVVDQLRHLVGDHHRHGGAGQRTAEHEWHQQRQLRRQHRYPERQLDADADGARQRQHRHRRRPGLGCDLHHQHHGGERRPGGDHHAGELRQYGAGGAQPQEQRAVDLGRGCRLRLHERDPGGDRGHAECGRRQQRRGGDQLRHLVGHHHGHGGAGQRALELQCHQQRQLRRQHRYPERLLDADADGARQRQHRHRWRPGLGCDLHHQHHGGERRACSDDHAGELRGDRADEPHAQGHRAVDQRTWMPAPAP